MPTKRVLLAWIGHSDFRAPVAESPLALRQEIMARVKGELTAVWLLPDKTRYPATFYETHLRKAWGTNVPFDLTLDVIPDRECS